MDRKLNVLHLLSWFPTPSDPYAGNFCLKQIQSVSDEVNSVVLSCCLEDEQESARRVEVVEYPNFKHLYVHVRRSKFGWWNKFLLFSAYHFGLRYVRCHFFNPDLIHQHVTLPLGPRDDDSSYVAPDSRYRQPCQAYHAGERRPPALYAGV